MVAQNALRMYVADTFVICSFFLYDRSINILNPSKDTLGIVLAHGVLSNHLRNHAFYGVVPDSKKNRRLPDNSIPPFPKLSELRRFYTVNRYSAQSGFNYFLVFLPQFFIFLHLLYINTCIIKSVNTRDMFRICCLRTPTAAALTTRTSGGPTVLMHHATLNRKIDYFKRYLFLH